MARTNRKYLQLQSGTPWRCLPFQPPDNVWMYFGVRQGGTTTNFGPNICHPRWHDIEFSWNLSCDVYSEACKLVWCKKRHWNIDLKNFVTVLANSQPFSSLALPQQSCWNHGFFAQTIAILWKIFDPRRSSKVKRFSNQLTLPRRRRASVLSSHCHNLFAVLLMMMMMTTMMMMLLLLLFPEWWWDVFTYCCFDFFRWQKQLLTA